MFSAPSNIIISNFIKFFLIFSIDGLAFSIKHCIGSYNSIIFCFSSNNFELYWLEVSSNNKKISFFYWSVSIFKIWDEVSFCQIPRDSFNCVFDWEYMNLSEIGDITSRSDLHNISKTNSEILSDGFVHSNFSLLKFVVNECDNQSFFSFLSLNKNGIAFEDLEFVHLCLWKLDWWILIVKRLLNLI